MKKFLLAIVFILLPACASLTSNLPDFQDGTWQNCTYKKGGRTKGPFPFQIPPGLQVPNIDDAMEIICVPITKGSSK